MAGMGQAPPEGSPSLYLRRWEGGQSLSVSGASLPEGCLLLLLYMYITSRPDGAASEAQWLQLEQEVEAPEPLVDGSPPRPTPPRRRGAFLPSQGTKGAFIHIGDTFRD